jgi:hypothetical protein
MANIGGHRQFSAPDPESKVSRDGTVNGNEYYKIDD